MNGVIGAVQNALKTYYVKSADMKRNAGGVGVCAVMMRVPSR